MLTSGRKNPTSITISDVSATFVHPSGHHEVFLCELSWLCNKATTLPVLTADKPYHFRLCELHVKM